MRFASVIRYLQRRNNRNHVLPSYTPDNLNTSYDATFLVGHSETLVRQVKVVLEACDWHIGVSSVEV